MTTYFELPQSSVRRVDVAAIGYEVFLITLAPVMVMQTGLLPSTYRIQVFGLFFIIALLPILHRELNTRSLGIRLDNLLSSLPAFGLFALGLSAAAIVILLQPGIAHIVSPGVASVLSPLAYLGISVPVQQLIYFGYLPARLKTLTKNQWLLALCIGTLFGAMHIPWQNPVLAVLALVIGVLWAQIYLRFPNLLLSIAAHIIFGGCVMWMLQIMA